MKYQLEHEPKMLFYVVQINSICKNQINSLNVTNGLN